MVIKSLRIKNFKSIEDSGEIPITKLFGLIGQNNSGKSALIEAIRTFFGQRELTIQDFHKNNGASVEIHLKFAPDFESEVSEDRDYIGTWSPEDLKSSFVSNGESIKATGLKKELPQLLVIPAIRNPAIETTAGAKSYLKELISAILAESTEGPAIDEQRTPAGKLSRVQLLSILQAKTKGELKSLSGKLSSNFQEAIGDKAISMEIDAEGDLAKALAYSTSIVDPNLGKKMSGVDILACGTGLQSMAILALLQTYAQGEEQRNIILMIEEPEVYLHPELQRKMFGAMRGIAKRNQVIFTTHSPIMISELWAEESLRLVRRKGGVSSFEKISIADVVTELGIRYEDVLNPKSVVFVEGPNDIEFFTAIAEKVSPKLLAAAGVKFVSADGYRNIHAYALMNILGSANVKCDAHAIVDGDGVPAASRKMEIENSIDKHLPPKGGASVASRLKIHVISQHELEGFLLDPAIIKVLISMNERDVREQLDFYRAGYLAAQTAAKTPKEAALKLARCYRPSLLFEPNPHPKFRKAFATEFKDDKKFLSFCDALAGGWASWKKKHPKPYAALILAAGFSGVDSLREPIALVEGIVK